MQKQQPQLPVRNPLNGQGIVLHRQIALYVRRLSEKLAYACRESEQGWTLVEFVLLTLLLVILVATAMVSVQSYGTMKVSGAARKLASDLELARQLAVSKQARSAVTLTANSYSVYEDYAALDLARDPMGGGNFVVDYTVPSYKDFAGVTLATSLPMNVVQFNSMGVPLDNTGTAFTAQQTITVTLGSDSTTLCIVPSTGKIQLC